MTLLGSAEEPETKEAKIKRGEEIISRLEGAVAHYGKKSEELTSELLAMDGVVEKKIDLLVEVLSSLKDSTDSGTRIENNKVDLIEGLRKSIAFYQSRRAEKEARFLSIQNEATKDDLKGDMDFLDERSEKRIGQIMELTKSFTQHEETNKYIYEHKKIPGANAYKTDRKVSPEYKQSKKAAGVGAHKREQLMDEMQGGVDKLVRENKVLQTNLRGAANQEAYDARLSEIERNEELIQELSEKIYELSFEGSEVKLLEVEDSEEAHDIELEVRDVVQGLQGEFRKMVALKTQLDLARSRYNTAEIKLDYNQKVMDKLLNP